MKEKKFLNKLLCFSLIFALLPWNILNPVSVKADGTGAHKSYFISTLLDSKGTYYTKTIEDTSVFGESKEEKEIKSDYDTEYYVNWSVVDYSTPLGASSSLRKQDEKPSLDDKTGLPLTFPAFKSSNSNATNDMNRADTIQKTLAATLNNLINQTKEEINYSSLTKASNTEDVANTIVLSRKINPAIASKTETEYWYIVQLGEMKIYYAKYNESMYKTYMEEPNAYYVPGATPQDNGAMLIDAQGNLMCYVVGTDEEPEGGSNGLIWAMPKGYVNPTNGINIVSEKDKIPANWGVENNKQPDYNPSTSTVGDARWLTVFSLAEFANAQAEVHNIIMDSAENGWNSSSNFIEDTIFALVYKIYSGINSLLGLSSISDLVYNQGSRGGSDYESGLMTSSWWNQVLKYHLIFQIMAWMMLIVAVAKILLQINFSTVNPQLTISIMDTLQKIFTVGFALALCIPFIKVMASLNNYIVGIFETQSTVDSIGNILMFGLGGIIILFGYLGITFTMNCIYIMRAVMIAILTASAPVFITSMAFAGPKQKGLFDNWLKELSANIFMQSVHAFALAFLFDIMGNSSILSRLVIYFSLLPIVDMCRQLIFGQAGGFAVAQGQKAADSAAQFVKSEIGGKALGAANSSLGAKAKSLGLDAKTVDKAGADGGGSATPGETKAGAALGRFSSMLSTVGDHRAQNGETKKERALGHVMKGLSKTGDYLQSTGGIMGNAVTRANLGDTGGSIQASKTHGEGLATATERMNHDIADAVENKKEKQLQKDISNYSRLASDYADKAAEDSEKMHKAADNDKDIASHFATHAAYNMKQSKKYGNKAAYAEKKLDELKERRGVFIDKSSPGKIKVSMNKFQGTKSADGWTKAAFTLEEAKNVYGNDYMDFYDKDTGYFHTGYNSIESAKGNNRQFVIEKDKLKDQIAQHEDWERYHRPQEKIGETGDSSNNGKNKEQESKTPDVIIQDGTGTPSGVTQ